MSTSTSECACSPAPGTQCARSRVFAKFRWPVGGVRRPLRLTGRKRFDTPALASWPRPRVVSESPVTSSWGVRRHSPPFSQAVWCLSCFVPTRHTPVRLRGASGGCGDSCGFSHWVCCRPLRREICWPSLDRLACAVALPPGLLVFLSRWLHCPALTPGNWPDDPGLLCIAGAFSPSPPSSSDSFLALSSHGCSEGQGEGGESCPCGYWPPGVPNSSALSDISHVDHWTKLEPLGSFKSLLLLGPSRSLYWFSPTSNEFFCTLIEIQFT